MDDDHGEPAAQDPRRLRHLPRRHPYGETNRRAHAVVTGEPDDRETIKSGSAGGHAEKGQLTLAPRRVADPSSWINRCRRTVRDYERRSDHHAAMVQWAMVIIMTRRLARHRSAKTASPPTAKAT